MADDLFPAGKPKPVIGVNQPYREHDPSKGVPIGRISLGPAKVQSTPYPSGHPSIPDWANPGFAPSAPGGPNRSLSGDFNRIFGSVPANKDYADPRIPAWSKPNPKPGGIGLSAPALPPLPGEIRTPVGSSAPTAMSEADSLNKFYDSQGYGPHSSDADVEKARELRGRQWLRGELAPSANDSPGPVGMRSIPPAAKPGVSNAPLVPQPATASVPAPDPSVSQAAPGGVGVIHRGPGVAPETYATGGPHAPSSGGSSQLDYDMMTLGIGPKMSAGDQMRAQYGEALRMANRAASHPDMYPPSVALGWSQHAAQIASAIQGHDADMAKINQQGDRAGQFAQMANMPQSARDMFLAANGWGPEQISQYGASSPNAQGPSMLPGPNVINPMNYGSVQDSPEMGDGRSILDGEYPLHVKARMFAQMPGIENPNSAHRQLFNSYMARQEALDPSFKQNMVNKYNPYSPGHEKSYDTSGIGGLLASPFMAGEKYLWGEDPAMQAQRDQFAKDMEALGYLPKTNTFAPNVGVPGPSPQ